MSRGRGPTGRVTIAQVAREAGVDRSTVSRVFSQPERLRAETVTHVREVAERLGYVPNPAAQTLRTGRPTNVALVVPDLTNPFIPPLALSVQKAAEAKGHFLFIGNADEAPKQEQELVTRFGPQVVGTILASPRSSDAAIRRMVGKEPLVLINRDIEGLPRVLINSGLGITQAVQHLQVLGHRRIAYVGGPARSWSNEQRRLAAEAACAAAGAALIEIAAGEASFDSGRRIAGALRDSGATAAVAFDDVTAQGLLVGLDELGVRVPADMSLVGCDDVLGAVTHPGLTSITSQAAEAGRVAMNLLFDLIEQPAVSDVRYVIDTQLVVRGTTTAPGAARADAAVAGQPPQSDEFPET